jgi:protein ImuB
LQTGGAFVLASKVANALRLTAVDALAEQEGLYPGLSLADTRARLPDVLVLSADPAADSARLAALAEACRRYTPTLAIDPPDGVVLDMTGGLHLFGGEAALMADLRARVARAGFSCRIAMADTPGMAWALARLHGEDIAALVGAGPAMLEQMSFTALRLPPDQIALLRKLGLRRIGQIAAAPRASLTRRLGRGFLDRLDEALGRRASPLIARLESTPHVAERRLLEPVCAEEHVLIVTQDLAADLAPRLEGEGLGARRLLLELFRVDGAVRRLEAMASRPLRDPARIAALFRERLASLNEGLEADFGFDQLRLTALSLEPLTLRTVDLAGGREFEADFAALADRLSARFGADAVRRFVHRPDRRLPEEGCVVEPFLRTAKAPATAPDDPSFDGAPLRPLRLFQPPQLIEVLAEIPEGPPERFRWRRVARRIVCAEGPERMEPEWWRIARIADAGPRDYYRLEDEKGCRYWVFRQGLYTDPDPPRWYLQGLFA